MESGEIGREPKVLGSRVEDAGSFSRVCFLVGLPVAFIFGCSVDDLSPFVGACARACVHFKAITSCLPWLEMVSLIPLHHMSGFICVLCQELMEFLRGALWKSLKTPDLMKCGYSRQQCCFWSICRVFVCSVVVFASLYFCHILSNLNEFLDWNVFPVICVPGASITHHCAREKQHTGVVCFVLFFSSPMKWKGNYFVAPPQCIIYLPNAGSTRS